MEKGNPTRSAEVNEFIQWVKSCEVKNIGKASLARRNFEFNEFINILKINLEKADSFDSKKLMKDLTLMYMCHALWVFQWHTIGRVDDVSQLQLEDIQGKTIYFILLFYSLVQKTCNILAHCP